MQACQLKAPNQVTLCWTTDIHTRLQETISTSVFIITDDEQRRRGYSDGGCLLCDNLTLQSTTLELSLTNTPKV